MLARTGCAGPHSCRTSRGEDSAQCASGQQCAGVNAGRTSAASHLCDPTPRIGFTVAAVCTGSGSRSSTALSSSNCGACTAYVQYGPGGSFTCRVTIMPPCACASAGSTASCTRTARNRLPAARETSVLARHAERALRALQRRVSGSSGCSTRREVQHLTLRHSAACSSHTEAPQHSRGNPCAPPCRLASVVSCAHVQQQGWTGRGWTGWTEGARLLRHLVAHRVADLTHDLREHADGAPLGKRGAERGPLLLRRRVRLLLLREHRALLEGLEADVVRAAQLRIVHHDLHAQRGALAAGENGDAVSVRTASWRARYVGV